MTEHVIPGSRERGDDASSKPVLSRHARRGAAASPRPAAEPGASHEEVRAAAEPAEGRTVEVAFELSPQTTQLPDPTAAQRDRSEAEAAPHDAPAPVETAAESAAPPSLPRTDVAPATAANPPAPATGPETTRADDVDTGSGRHAPAARVAADSSPRASRDAVARGAEDEVRRVEASEVGEPEAGHGGWMSALIPIPGAPASHRNEKKVPFWKRIALTRNAPTPPTGSGATPRPLSLEPILTRLNALEKQIAANQSATEGQLARFEENITRLWELEEQLTLTEVRERLALLEANQREIADALHTVGRNLTLLAVVLAAGLMAGLLALGLLL